MLFEQDKDIDTVLLACTHYPLLEEKIVKYLPEGVRLVAQGPIVAESLADYLGRHPDTDERITQNGKRLFFTTDAIADFEEHATIFFGSEVKASHVSLDKPPL